MPQANALLDLLLERGLLKPSQLEHVVTRAEQEGRAVEDIIRLERLVFPESLAQVQAQLAAVPYIDLDQVKISEAAMADISWKAAGTYRFVAFDVKADKLLVAMESPQDFQALEAVKFIAKKRGLTPEVYLASSAGIDKALGREATITAEIGGALQEFSQALATMEKDNKSTANIEQFAEEAPVTQVVAVIIRHGIEGLASDIHIEPTAKELRVRYRIDGKLYNSLTLPLKVHAPIVSRIKILANLKIDEARLPQDGRFSITTDQRAFDFRVSTMPTTFGEKVALRILDKSRGAPSLDELGLIGPTQAIFKQYIHSPHGIILLSGPTGAGKSTTLFTTLSLVNVPDVNIVTLEDPVEYEIEGINQTQVLSDIGLTFASGLRSILRQDPDIIMVGEIRDHDTAELAIHAALTGHLVLTTIHTNDAIGTIPRLIDMGIDPFLLTASLRLLAAQRLVGKLCQKCKKPVEIPAKLKATITTEIARIPDQYKPEDNQKTPKVLYESPGCPACGEKQVVGRTGIFEIVPISRALREAMNKGAEYDKLQTVARAEGNLTMRQDGLLKALQGEVLFEDVLRVTADNEDKTTYV